MSFDTVMKYFREISAIPRGSGNTEKISAYCERFAEERGLDYIRDKAGNVIIKKEGHGNPVILQGHLDMVCECEPPHVHDFANEGIKLIEKDGFLSAENTTLGADDGSAAAIMLALLDDETVNSPIEAVFTVDEEIGMPGAKALDMTTLNARTMINIDSEEEGVITAGCAGGEIVTVALPLKTEKRRGFKYELTVSGLTGGHSGTEIGKNRANAGKLLGKLLRSIGGKTDFSLVSAEGGNKDNAIPRTASAVIVTQKDETELIRKSCGAFEAVMKKTFAETDPQLEIGMEVRGETEEAAADAKELIKFICGAPCGVLALDSEKNVLTSVNMGILKVKNGAAEICFSFRSNLADGYESEAQRIEQGAAALGGKTQRSGKYPCWEYCAESPLRGAVIECYREQTGREARVEVIHAGLECGIFASKLSGLDAVSIGPDIFDIHTPKERMSIESFERTYELVKAVLKKINSAFAGE